MRYFAFVNMRKYAKVRLSRHYYAYLAKTAVHTNARVLIYTYKFAFTLIITRIHIIMRTF